MGCIYGHRNKITGDWYIGKSRFDSDTVMYGRWGSNGWNYRGETYFWNAIKKYGWNNFEHIIIEDHILLELLNEKEKFYIAQYHSYIQDPLYKGGYNLTPGGELSFNTWWIEEDVWLIENYTKFNNRNDIVKAFKLNFENNYHSDAAIKARLKTLRLSNINNVNFWTEVEQEKLAELWPVANKEVILATFPLRSWRALEAQAKKQKLTRNVDCSKKYSKIEYDILKENYEIYGPEYCQIKIKDIAGVKRSLNSIHDHATKILNLHYHERYTEKVGFNLSLFKKLYYNQGVNACCQEFNLTPNQIYQIAYKNNCTRNKCTVKTGPAPRKVKCIELDIIFNSALEATIYLNVKPSNEGHIKECAKGTRKSACGYHWEFVE